MFFLKQAWAGLLAAMVIALLSPPHTPASAADLPRAVLIIDGSGSMWGRIDKREKIVIAREQLADNISVLQGKVDLGVMSYGHRRRRDCRDIEMIVPIGPIDPVSYGKTIKRLLPRGKTPVSSALQMAAEAIYSPDGQRPKSQKSHIILVADGFENCRLDPCKTATSLASSYPGLTIDVIGFGLADVDTAQLQCISNATRGRFHKANDSLQLKQAIEQIFAGIGPDKTPRIITKKPKVKTQPGLYLTAGLAKNDTPLEQNVSWRIYKAGESSKTSSTPLKRKNRAAPVLQLPKGKYHIEARFGTLMAQQDVELRGQKVTKLHLSFNVGVLAASARLGKSAPLSENIIFSLYDASQGPVGPSNIIAHKQQKKPVFYLPPGKYSLKARINETQAQHDFTLKAGERKNHTLLLNAGQLSLTTHLVSGAPALHDVQYAIYRYGPNSTVEFVRTLDPSPQLILPAGKYFVLTRKGSASNHAKLSIEAGQSREIPLVLNGGTLKLSSNLDVGTDTQKAQIAYTIESIGPTHPKTIKLSANGQLEEIKQSLPIRSFRNTFVLPNGEYLVHALYGNSNARASARIVVKAGRESHHRIELSAGRIKLSLVSSAGGSPLPGVFWSILDKTDKQVASASSITPRLTLSKGSYTAVADYLGKSYRREFILENGADKTIQLKLQ